MVQHAFAQRMQRLNVPKLRIPEIAKDLSGPEIAKDLSGIHKGSHLVGDYTVLDCLGQGAFGSVHRARLGHDDVHVALKLLKHQSEEAECVARREFEMLRAIDHPNIIKAYSFIPARHCEDTALVLELFHGRNLASALRASGRLPADTALRLFLQLLEAISYLHARGIIHRDIKAENVLVAHDLCRMKLVDFNVATWVERGALTPTGTPAYFAPEVLHGEPPDEAQDVWGAGLCLCRMLQQGKNEHYPQDQQNSMEGICGAALSRSLQPDKSRRAKAPALLDELRAQLSLVESAPAVPSC